jgi:restriction system protein
MPVPDFQAIMLPLLRLAGDGGEHRLGDAVEHLAGELGLTPEERRERLASGMQTRFANRVGWARTHLVKAGALTSPRRGYFAVTERGRELLARHPEAIAMRDLEEFPGYLDFRRGRRVENGAPPADVEMAEASPEELLDASYQALSGALADDLLDRIKRGSPAFFEQLVVDLLVAMGYGGSHADAARAVGRAGDEGIDGIIKEDRLGLDVVYVQAKRWENPVRRPDVQAFAGSLDGQRARKGVFITTSRFTPDARDYVGRIEKRIVLIDGDELTELMIEHGVGVSEVARYAVKHVDEDYFDQQGSAVLEPPRAASEGVADGSAA